MIIGKGHAVRRNEQFPQLLDEYGVSRRGVVHVGAHEGEEVPVYEELEFESIILVEPIPELAEALRHKFPKCSVVEAACGLVPGNERLHIPHKTNLASLNPDPTAGRAIDVQVITLHDAAPQASVAVIDAQGRELDVVKGCHQLAAHFDALVVETCTVEDPSMASGYDETTGYLTTAGFTPVAYWTRDYQWVAAWGRKHRPKQAGEIRDVLYIADRLIPSPKI